MDFRGFVVLFLERSGSTYLLEGLAAHPQVVAWPEYFAALRQKGRTADDQIGWLREFLDAASHPEHRAAGFKTKLCDVLDPERFTDVLVTARARLLVLRRRNLVKQAVSLCNAVRLERATGDWNLYAEDRRLPRPRIEPGEFDRTLRALEKRSRKLAAFADRLPLARLDVWYEDLLTAHDSTFATVFRHLGVEPVPVVGRAAKNTSDSLQEAVENFAELRAAYAATDYAAQFDEVLVDPGS